MAVTSLWAIRSHLSHLVDYAANPDKTLDPEAKALCDVLHYADDDSKTAKRFFVTGINCNEDTAYQKMMDAHRLSDKPVRVPGYHGYQSFAEGEVDAETAHEIGVKLARELWGENYVVVVATHLNTGKIHNHFVLGSSSIHPYGKRFHNDHAERRRMAAVSDRLCREYGLSVCDSIYGSKAKSYAERMAEKQGKPTYTNLVKADVGLAISQSLVMLHFFIAMEALGYEIKYGKHLAVRAKGRERFRRLDTIGEDYTEAAILRRIMANRHRAAPYREYYSSLGTYRFRGTFKKHPRLSGFRALYFHYMYKMKILPQHKEQGRRASPLLREDLVKLDAIMEQSRFLRRYKIDTAEQLVQHRDSVQNQMTFLDAARLELRRKIRRNIPVEQIMQAKSELTAVTVQMRELRKELKLCDAVEERSKIMCEKLKTVQAIEQAERDRQRRQKGRNITTI